MPWALVTEDKLTWEWLSHQSLSFCAHLRLWATRPKFCHQSEFKKRNLTLALTPCFACSNCLAICIFQACLRIGGRGDFAPLRCASTSSQESRLPSFIYFAAKAYCVKVLSLGMILEKCAHVALWSNGSSGTRALQFRQKQQLYKLPFLWWVGVVFCLFPGQISNSILSLTPHLHPDLHHTT